jgi:hypothetical protein
MPFDIYQSFTSARTGRPMSLHRSHIDPALVTLTFHYSELVLDGDVWIVQEHQHVLEEAVHYSLNARDGQIALLDHPFWQQEGLWRAADRIEPLLYKGQIQHPQRIEFSYEYYTPMPVTLPAKVQTKGTVKIFREAGQLRMVDFAEIDQEASQRLGYNVLKYTLALSEET